MILYSDAYNQWPAPLYIVGRLRVRTKSRKWNGANRPSGTRGEPYDPTRTHTQQPITQLNVPVTARKDFNPPAEADTKL